MPRTPSFSPSGSGDHRVARVKSWSYDHHLKVSSSMQGHRLRTEAAPPAFTQPRTAGLIEEFCLARLGARFRGVPAQIELWDGTTRSLSDAQPIATIHVRDRSALLGLLTQPAIGFGEAYTAGRLE